MEDKENTNMGRLSINQDIGVNIQLNNTKELDIQKSDVSKIMDYLMEYIENYSSDEEGLQVDIVDIYFDPPGFYVEGINKPNGWTEIDFTAIINLLPNQITEFSDEDEYEVIGGIVDNIEYDEDEIKKCPIIGEYIENLMFKVYEYDEDSLNNYYQRED